MILRVYVNHNIVDNPIQIDYLSLSYTTNKISFQKEGNLHAHTSKKACLSAFAAANRWPALTWSKWWEIRSIAKNYIRHYKHAIYQEKVKTHDSSNNFPPEAMIEEKLYL